MPGRRAAVLLASLMLAAFTVAAGKLLLTATGGTTGGATDGAAMAGPGIALVVHGVEDPFMTSVDYAAPPEGRRWLAVDVEVRNRSTTTTRVSGVLDFVVRDGLGWSYPAVFVPDELPPLVARLRPDGSIRGTIVFQLPDEAAGVSLTMIGGRRNPVADVALP